MVVDSVGQQLFAGSGFTEDENGGGGGGDDLDLIEHRSQRGASTDDVVELILRAHLFLEVKRFILALAAALGGGLGAGQGVGPVFLAPRAPLHILELEVAKGPGLDAGES